MVAVSVVYNTLELFQRAYESIRKFHPGLEIIIIDGSDKNNPCYDYVKNLRKEAQIFQVGYNIGHGPGLHLGLHKCDSKTALIFDSDIEMLKSPLSGMLGMLDGNTYGVGWITEIGLDGFDFGTPGRHIGQKPIPYLHPYFALLNVDKYFKYHKFVLHGAPCYKAMIDLHEKGGAILKQFPGLTGHTSGHGINWIGKPSEYIRHDFGGTRKANKQQGKKEIEGKWER